MCCRNVAVVHRADATHAAGGTRGGTPDDTSDPDRGSPGHISVHALITKSTMRNDLARVTFVEIERCVTRLEVRGYIHGPRVRFYEHRRKNMAVMRACALYVGGVGWPRVRTRHERKLT